MENKIKNLYTYFIDINYLNKAGDKLCEVINGWLKENKCDVHSYTFNLANGEGKGSLMVDYEYDVENPEKIKMLVEQVLDRFNIEYELEE